MADDVNFFAAQFPLICRKSKYFICYRHLTLPSMSIFNSELTLELLNKMGANTMVSHLGIEFTAIGEDWLEAKMPVDARTHQPLGLLHGGASVALAETMGSVAATFCVDLKTQYCVGLDINANHLKSVKTGFVYGITTPFHIGKKTHVWEIRITNDEKELVCISRITMAVIDRR